MLIKFKKRIFTRFRSDYSQYIELDATLYTSLSMFLTWFMQEIVGSSSRVSCIIVFFLEQPIAMFSFNHCVISRLGNLTSTLLLVGWAKIQYIHDDEPTIFCVNQE